MIRSTIFNIAFYGFTALACILCLPCLFLPKKQAMLAVRIFVYGTHTIEKYILGLDYEVRGRENLPKSSSFIVAAKHESPYETTKLNILFDDPAIVLKRELLRIPLWGRFLAKVEPIAIDRSAGKEAMEQIIEGAKRVRDQGRPIVIFPQGTRVYPWQTTAERPYRPGVARTAQAAELPIIPMALNSGMFWPRKSWLKHPGKVVFEVPAAAEHGSGCACADEGPGDEVGVGVECAAPRGSRKIRRPGENLSMTKLKAVLTAFSRRFVLAADLQRRMVFHGIADPHTNSNPACTGCPERHRARRHVLGRLRLSVQADGSFLRQAARARRYHRYSRLDGAGLSAARSNHTPDSAAGRASGAGDERQGARQRSVGGAVHLIDGDHSVPPAPRRHSGIPEKLARSGRADRYYFLFAAQGVAGGQGTRRADARRHPAAGQRNPCGDRRL